MLYCACIKLYAGQVFIVGKGINKCQLGSRKPISQHAGLLQCVISHLVCICIGSSILISTENHHNNAIKHMVLRMTVQVRNKTGQRIMNPDALLVKVRG